MGNPVGPSDEVAPAERAAAAREQFGAPGQLLLERLRTQGAVRPAQGRRCREDGRQDGGREQGAAGGRPLSPGRPQEAGGGCQNGGQQHCSGCAEQVEQRNREQRAAAGAEQVRPVQAVAVRGVEAEQGAEGESGEHERQQAQEQERVQPARAAGRSETSCRVQHGHARGERVQPQQLLVAQPSVERRCGRAESEAGQRQRQHEESEARREHVRQQTGERQFEQEAGGGKQERRRQEPPSPQARLLRMRGSSRSRRPSPRKLKPMTLSMIMSPGNTPIHHACFMKERPSASMRPQLGSGGCVPSPKKLSAASARIANARLTDTWAIIGPSEFGRMCFKSTCSRLRPSAPAAVTNSRWRTLSTAPRATRAKMGMYTMAIAIIALPMPRPRIAMMVMARSTAGKANSRSMRRMITSSVQPPKKPARAPSRTPAKVEMLTAMSATRTDTAAPWRMREKMSRPNSSVPSRCAADGGLSLAPKSISTGS